MRVLSDSNKFISNEAFKWRYLSLDNGYEQKRFHNVMKYNDWIVKKSIWVIFTKKFSWNINDSFYIDTLAENSHLEGKLKLLKEREAENDITKNKEDLEIKNLEKNLKTLKGEIKSLEADQKASRGSGNFFQYRK